MHIIGLKIENVKRIKAVEIDTNGKSFVEVTGRNGQGKSSILDAIAMAIGGAALIPERPIRDGETFATIEIDVGDFVVRRIFGADGYSSIKITSKDGFERKSPQKFLDELVGTLSFDPVAFTNMDPKKRVEFFKKLAGIDTTKLDAEYQDLYSKRRDLNAILKRAQAEFDSVAQYSEDVEVPSIAGLQKQRDEAIYTNNKMRDYQNDVLKMNREIDALNKTIDEARLKIINLQSLVANAELTLMGMTAIAVEPIIEKINNIEPILAKRQKHQEYLKAQKYLDEATEACTKINNEIKKNVDKISKLLADKQLPVKGLELDKNELYFNKIPFDQLSQAERLRVSMAMAIAENPKLRILRIMEGSLLDHASMEAIKEMAIAHEFQVFVETVSDDKDERDALYIEDGRVA